MSAEIMEYMTLITLTVISLLVARGVVFHALAFFFPPKSIKLSYTDNSGKKHTKLVNLSDEDDELINFLTELRANGKARRKDS
ncbi:MULTISPECIES: hypothetical protein [Serratia]|uniref:Uncharacterized protein n=1 Tax=Serratia liquefaciens TaxID=614 RepID=A0A515CQQ9_SERLI|nr:MULTISPECIES: hypothetical protein [Serratia]QDL30423.1 hypothetical protein EGO53_00815 [Serratia liquefaciens]QJW53922.1 hypothetical protein HL670_00781 [Serratia plymuthica]